MATPAFIGVDIGTSSTKGVAVGQDGRVLRKAARANRVNRPRPGQAEMDAAEWWTSFVEVTRELVSGGDFSILAVGVDGIGPCVCVADRAGTPLRPAILYGIDTRAVAQIVQLTERYSEAAIRSRSGNTLSTQAVGPKLAWIADNEPEIWRRSRRLFMPSSYLVWRLTGAYTLDHHSASQSSPLYDIRAKRWFEPWWDDLAGGIEQPTLGWPGEIAGEVTLNAADATGLPVGVPVVFGTIDAWAEAVSVGAQRVGDLMLMYGSTMFLIHTTSIRQHVGSMWTTTGAFPGIWNLAGGMASAGAVIDWLSDVTGLETETLVHEAAVSPPGASGIVMLPYLQGERTPIVDPSARGVIAGLTLSHSRGDICRAALEATAYGVRHHLEAMSVNTPDLGRVIAVGGGLRSSVWPQIVSDVSGLEQETCRVSIGASYGSAFLAATSVASFAIEKWNPVQSVVTPDLRFATLYDECYGLYRELYSATASLVHRLADMRADAPRMKES